MEGYPDIAGETHEYTGMYPGMAKAVRKEGFVEIAGWFETLAKAEKLRASWSITRSIARSGRSPRRR